MDYNNMILNMERNTISIYYDPNFVTNHNSGHGSIECGSRVKIKINKYRRKGFRIVYPNPKPIYTNFLQKLHSNNPIIKYLSTVSFKQNFMEKLFHKKPKNKLIRNCHICTIETASIICPICKTKYDKNKFFKYAHLIDKTISESDTTYITDTSYETVKNAVSLVCQMMEDVKYGKTKHGFAIIRPPGHHACYNKSEGYCLINNTAIATEYGLFLGFRKIFIFDFDAQHGNGIQKIFYQNKNVFYCSIHTKETYPFTGNPDEIGEGDGKGYNLNIIVPKNIDDHTYLDIYRSEVLTQIIKFNPDLILVSAGFNGLATDPLQIMNLTPECYGEIIKSLAQLTKPVCLVLEGGYDIVNLPLCYNICLNMLMKN